MLQDSTTLSTFSRPLFGLIIHVYYEAVKTSNVASQSPGNVPGSGNEPGVLVLAQITVGGQSIEAKQPSGSTREPKEEGYEYPKGTTLRWPATQLTQWSPP